MPSVTVRIERLRAVHNPGRLAGWVVEGVTERATMSTGSVIARYGAPAALGSVATAVMTVAINFATSGKPGWWWIVVAFGCVGLAASVWWGYGIQQNGSGQSAPRTEAVAQQDAGVAQQSATGHGTNISVNADRGSAAAYRIDTVNLQRGQSSPTSEP
jgi:hypothetical protein